MFSLYVSLAGFTMKFTEIYVIRVGVGIMSQLSIVALFLEMDYLRILKIAPDIK